MRFDRRQPPREFEVGRERRFTMRDCGTVHLEADEQVTFVTDAGGEYDLARKEWGFYATPSLNGRLPRFGLRGVLVRNVEGRYFLLLVERGHEASFEEYMRSERLVAVAWLDSHEAFERLEDRLGRP